MCVCVCAGLACVRVRVCVRGQRVCICVCVSVGVLRLYTGQQGGSGTLTQAKTKDLISGAKRFTYDAKNGSDPGLNIHAAA